MTKKFLKGILAFAFAGCIFGTNIANSYTPVNAVEQGDLDDAKDAIAEKEKEIAQLQATLDALSTDIASTQAYITQLDAMMADLVLQINDQQAKIDAKQLEIDEKTAQIDAKQIEINNTQIELEEAQLKEAEHYKEMSYRIQYMYECGDETFLDMLFSSEDLSDLLGKSEYISSITTYDREQLEALVALKENIDLLLVTLQTEIAALDAEKVVLEEEKKVLDTYMLELNYSQQSMDAIMANKMNTLATLENQQSYTEEQKAAAEQELKDQQEIFAYLQAIWDEQQKELQQSGVDADAETQKTLDRIKAAGGFTWPLPGYNKITSEWGMRNHPITGENRLHDGFDISGYAVNGKPIVAAASGTVILSQYYWGYGNCVQISHGTGVVTLYAHCSALAVNVGDVVSAGQVIGYVGSTGNSTGPHLHYSIFIQGESINPRIYMTIPS